LDSFIKKQKTDGNARKKGGRPTLVCKVIREL